MPDRRLQSDDDDPDEERIRRRDGSWDDGGFEDESENDSEDDSEDDEHAERDRRRFASETAFCPDCGAEVYDAADVCPKCFTWINGDTVRHPRARSRERLRRIVVWILIGAMLLGAGVFALRQWI
ncbi:MAG: zinc ribbon domain-containing protein [Planctomycetaceae bacterium]|nr:zinc ribbon domain-containing protein [Planctomycetaceae bacterium]